VPYLYLSPLLLMIFQVVENQFIIIKKSYYSALTLSVGAIANILLNWLLIPIMGIEGAALSTLIGYTLSVIVMSFVAIRHKLHFVSKRFLFISAMMVLYLILVRLYFYENILGQTFLSIVSILILLQLYKEELRLIYTRLRAQQIK